MPAVVVGAIVAGGAAVVATAATAGFAAVTLATFAVPAAIALGTGLISRAFGPKLPSFVAPGGAIAGSQANIGSQRAARTVGAISGTGSQNINSAISPTRWIVGQVRCTGRIVWLMVHDDDVMQPRDTLPGGWAQTAFYDTGDEAIYQEDIYRSTRDNNIGSFPAMPEAEDQRPANAVALNLTSSGNVVVAFSEFLDTTSVPDATSFTVYVDSVEQTVSSIDIGLNKILVSVGIDVETEHDIILAFTNAGDLLDVGGNAVNNIGNTLVNKTPLISDDLGSGWSRVESTEQATKPDTVSDLHMALVLSEGACEGIDEIWLDGEKLPVGKGTSGGHNVFTAPGFECHEYFKADGSEGAESFAAAAKGNSDLTWDASSVQGKGLSWVYVKLTQNDYGRDLDSRRYNRIPNIEFVVKGIKIGPNRNPNTGMKTWTENAALIRKWWMTERRGIPWRSINNTYFRAAVTRCDTTISISTLTGFDSSAMQSNLKRYTINGLIHSGDDVTRIEQDFDFAWDGSVVEWDGDFLFRPGGDRQAVREIVPDDIIEEPIYKPGTTLGSNRYLCRLPQSEWHDWQPYDIRVDDTGKQDYDGSVQTLDLGATEFVTNPAQAANLLRSAARRARASSSIEVLLKPGDDFSSATILPGDKVTLSLLEFGISAQHFMVVDTRVLEGWAIKLTLVEWGSDWFMDQISLEHYAPRQVVQTSGRALGAPRPVTVLIAASTDGDGKFVWYALITAPESLFELVIFYRRNPDDEPLEFVTFSNQAVITINQAGFWDFEVRHRSRDGRVSPATTVRAEATFDVNLPPAPVLARKAFSGGFARWVFSNLGPFVNGIEIAYTFEAPGSATTPGLLTADTWGAADKLGQYPIVPASALTDERTIVQLLPQFGGYNLYARGVDIAGRQTDLVHLGLVEYTLDAPINIDVDVYGDGTRAYLFTLPGNEAVAGCQIRYKKAGDAIPTPGPIENAPPTLIAANGTEDGDIVLAYSEPLDEDSTPARAAWSVDIGGTTQRPSAVAIDSNTVTLTLNTKIAAGDTVTLDFTNRMNNALQDTHGEAAGNFSGHVVNNVIRGVGHEIDWLSMERLHEGYITASPYLAKIPGAGIFDIAFRTQAVSGHLSEIARTQVTLGEPVQLDIVTAVQQAIADNPALVTLTDEVTRAQEAERKAAESATNAAASASASETSRKAAETAEAAAELAETNVATALGSTQQAKTDAETAQAAALAEAQKAASSATEAAGSATAASGSATTASNRATAADGSATAAASSASAAATSASAAGNSAVTAAGSATTAATKATEAGSEAGVAKTERIAAEAAKDDAETAQAAAETAQTSAVSAKQDAESAQSAATTQASNAAKSANAAGESASAASSHASTAASEASDAETSATAAQTAETAAETAQSKAETAESNASSSATEADGSARAAAGSLSSVQASASAAESAKDDAETAESNAASSASAAASSAQTATAKASDASQSASAASAAETAAETAQSKAETAESNAASSATDADGSAKAAASSASGVGTSASNAAGSATAAAASASTAASKATEAANSADAAATSATSAATQAAAAGTSATDAATSKTGADGSAMAAATSAAAAAASAAAVGNADASATAAATSAQTATTKATEAAQSASAAATSATNAATSASNASTSETNASAAETNASGSAAVARTERVAAAGFADDAEQAVAGISTTVSAQIDTELQTTFASIVALRAVAGSAEAKFELVALSDPSGTRAAGVISADFQSDSYAPVGGTVPAQAAKASALGMSFTAASARAADNGATIEITAQRVSSASYARDNPIVVSGAAREMLITLNAAGTVTTNSFARSDIADEVDDWDDSLVTALGSGFLAATFRDQSGTVSLGAFPSSPVDMTEHNGKMYGLAGVASTTVYDINVANPSASSSLGNALLRVPSTRTGLNGRGLASHGGKIYAIGNLSGQRPRLFEISVAGSPSATHIGQLPSSLADPRSMASHGGTLYCIDSDDNDLWEIDVDSPGSSARAGGFSSSHRSPQALAAHDGKLLAVIRSTPGGGTDVIEVNTDTPSSSTILSDASSRYTAIASYRGNLFGALGNNLTYIDPTSAVSGSVGNPSPRRASRVTLRGGSDAGPSPFGVGWKLSRDGTIDAAIGEFRGSLTASQISADVRNWVHLGGGTGSRSDHGVADIDDHDWIVLLVRLTNRNILGAIPRVNLNTSTGQTIEGVSTSFTRNADGTQINSSSNIIIPEIWGVKNPS